MTRTRSGWHIRLLLVVALLLTVATVTGCGTKKSTTTNVAKPAGETAKNAYPTALTAVEATAAPDAKLLLVQTARTVTPTSTPVWAYLFGSPKSEKLFIVEVQNGKADKPTLYGTAAKGQIEWAKVPGIDQWKIDSDEAYVKAVQAAAIKGTPPYLMGFLTYTPSSQATSTAEPFVWNVQFTSGFTGVIRVNATTGAVTTQQ